MYIKLNYVFSHSMYCTAPCISLSIDFILKIDVLQLLLPRS